MRLAFLLVLLLVVLTACSSVEQRGGNSAYAILYSNTVAGTNSYCQNAQRVVNGAQVPMDLVLHDNFDAFVKSKAIIDGPNGPQIQQYNWYDAAGNVLGVSCKLKSAEHLKLVFGEDSAGLEGLCQDMNQGLYKVLEPALPDSAFEQVVFDKNETVSNKENPGMTGPDWLAPFTMTYAQGKTLHIASKGFVVEFTDPRYQQAPARFRGVHYCHLVAPAHLRNLLRGKVPAETVIGRLVDVSGPAPTHSQ